MSSPSQSRSITGAYGMRQPLSNTARPSSRSMIGGSSTVARGACGRMANHTTASPSMSANTAHRFVPSSSSQSISPSVPGTIRTTRSASRVRSRKPVVTPPGATANVGDCVADWIGSIRSTVAFDRVGFDHGLDRTVVGEDRPRQQRQRTQRGDGGNEPPVEDLPHGSKVPRSARAVAAARWAASPIASSTWSV